LSVQKVKISILCLLAVVLVTVLPQGCGSLSALQPDQSAWKGHTIDELTASWGQPDKIEKLGVDYNAFTWLKPGTSCEQTFLVSDGRITGYSSNDCDN